MKGDGYDDEGFEDYSDEFENEEDDRDEQPSVVRHSRAMTHGKSILADCARPSKSPVVSPALKMRQTEHLQAPDNKVKNIWTPEMDTCASNIAFCHPDDHY